MHLYTSAVTRPVFHFHSNLSMLKLSLSGLGAFFSDRLTSAFLTLASFTLCCAVPLRRCGGPIRSSGGGGIATFFTISDLSSSEMAVLPSEFFSAGMVDDAHGFVYRSSVQHLLLFPRILFDSCKKAAQHPLFARLMV